MNPRRPLLFLSLLLLISTDSLFAQRKNDTGKPIDIGQIITINSRLLNEQRQIYVSLPDGYDTLSNLSVVYVLDAEYRFAVAQSIRSYFSITTRIPRTILIGIANPTRQARQRDYLPKSYGGEAEKFTRFLSEEVFAFVEGRYKASKKRYLTGHSNGAVFVVYTLLNNPDLFEGYIAIDPGLKHIYNESDTLLNRELTDKRLYLASTDVAYGYMEDVAADMQADFAIFKNRLYQTREKNKLTFKIDHINDDHGNSYIQGFSRGLRYLFDWRFE
jgi:predicted alpha/beta superfamily hydrolase